MDWGFALLFASYLIPFVAGFAVGRSHGYLDRMVDENKQWKKERGQ